MKKSHPGGHVEWRLSRGVFLRATEVSCGAGGAGGGFLGPGDAGADVPVQELHPDDDGRRRGAALPDGPAVREIHQTRHPGAEGQVDPAHGGLWTRPKQEPRPSKTLPERSKWTPTTLLLAPPTAGGPAKA